MAVRRVSGEIERFLYRGTAVGFGGRITKPANVKLPAQASVALPIVGGEVEDTMPRGFRSARGIITCDYAKSWAEGEIVRNQARTEVNTVVKNFKIVSANRSVSTVVRIKHVSATMISTHGLNRGEQTAIKIDKLGGALAAGRSGIWGLTINGQPVKVTYAPQIARTRDTLEKLKSAYDSSRGHFRAQHDHLFHRANRRIARKLSPSHGMVLCTFVKRAAWDKSAGAKPIKGVQFDINSIVIPNFGTIYLGEMIISEFDRRFTMVRMTLGCPVNGEIGVGIGGADGSTWPPG